MKRKGFTLIELLIVIAIIGIITSIILAYLSAAKAKGRDAQRIANIKQIEQALEVYFSSCNTYPSTLQGLATDCQGNPILASIPTDPTGVQYSYYLALNPTLQYHVCATLQLGYAGGLDKSGHARIAVGDKCDGTQVNVYDKYGP